MTTTLTLDGFLAPEPTKQPEPHAGVIRVDSRVLESMGIDWRGCNTQGRFEDKGVFTAVHKKFLLPESYTVSVLYWDWQSMGTWCVGVLSPDLPEVERGDMPPIITPLYQRADDGTVRLLSIRIEGSKWERVYSPDELTLERL